MKKIIILTICLASAFLFYTCKKNLDSVPARDLRDGTVYTVTQLKSIATCTGGCQNKRFTYEAYLKGVVIADEFSGNFNKELYIRDAANTGGIHLSFLANGSNIFIGDSVRLNIKGYDIGLNTSTKMLEIDSIDFEKNLVKYNSGAKPQPIQVDFSQLSTSNPYSKYFCELISINNVNFIASDTNKIYADVINQLSNNWTIQDCAGNQVVVRTNNSANFSSEKTPGGFGSITGIATAYGATNQLQLRNSSEVNMNGTRCVIYHKKDFDNSSITSGSWTQVVVTNTAVTWAVATYSSTTFIKISGYVGGNKNSENWLISPSLNLSLSSNPVINFRTAAKYTGNALEVWVSSNYISGNPGAASWVQITNFTLSPNTGNYDWTASGSVSLSSFKNVNTRIAFKYKSTTSGATTYQLDDIVIREN